MTATTTSSLEEHAPSAQLTELLSALDALESSNSQVVSLIAGELGVGATELRALFFIGRSEGEATPKAVAAFLGLTAGATTSVLDRMAEAGLVVRAPHPTDRRSILIALAPKGATAIASIYGFLGDAVFEALAPAEVPAIAAAFRAIGDALVRRAQRDLVA